MKREDETKKQTFVTHQKDEIKQQKKRDTFPTHQKALDETTEDNTDIS